MSTGHSKWPATAATQSPRSAGFIRFIARVLPTTAAMGSLLPMFGPIFGFRAVAVIFMLYALTYPPPKSPRYLSRPVATLAALWVTTGLIHTVFVIDVDLAARTLASVTIGLLLAMATLRVMSSEPRLLDWLAQGWILSFFVTAGIALWELNSGNHLSNYYLSGTNFESGLPAASFVNPNAYAIYLVGVQAVVLWLLGRTKTLPKRIVLMAVLASCPLLVLVTGSRLSLLGMLLMITVFAALDRVGAWRAIVASLTIVFILWQVLPGATAIVADYIPADVKDTSISQVLFEVDEADTSGGRRLELNRTALWLTAQTGGFGVGPGNFGAAILKYEPPYSTGEILSPHSFVGELTSEFGLTVLVGFAALMFSIVRRISTSKGPERSVVIATGIAFIPAGLANSGYLISSTMWLLFATMLCFVVVAESKTS